MLFFKTQMESYMNNTKEKSRASDSALTRAIEKIQAFIRSDACKIVLFAIACATIILDKAVFGTLLFVVITSLMLALPNGGIHSLFPFLLVCGISIRCYNSYGDFIVYWPLALLPIFVLIAKLVLSIKSMRKRSHSLVGKSFYGNLAVAFAVTLGGLGSISPGEYFSPAALYYVFFLGFGMIIFYLAARDGIFKSRENLFSEFAKIMYIFGVFCVFCIIYLYATQLPIMLESKTLTFSNKFQWKNNVATMLLLCMPFPFYFSKKNCLHSIFGFLIFISLLLTTSRGAILIAPIELILCLAYSFHYNKKNILCFLISTGLSLVSLFAIDRFLYLNGIENLFESTYLNVNTLKELFSIFSSEDSRKKLLFRSFEDFASSPIFGKGLGNTSNTDIYNPKKGALGWYHMMIPQVIGGLGVVGILGYGYQFFVRIKLIFKKISSKTLCLGISYFGILLMSQVNPGEFCPLPYELLTVLIFIFLEKLISDSENQTQGI